MSHGAKKCGRGAFGLFQHPISGKNIQKYPKDPLVSYAFVCYVKNVKKNESGTLCTM